MEPIRNLKGHAVRYGTTVEVTVKGLLPNSCYDAQVLPYDPNVHASNELHIILVEGDSSPFCSVLLSEWAKTTRLNDTDHAQVDVMVNGIKQIEVTIKDTSKDQFEVCSQVFDLDGNPGTRQDKIRICNILPAGDLMFRICDKRFGPASYQACQDWIALNCSSHKETT